MADAPGVEHGREPDPGPEVLRVGRDREQRVGRRAEQEVVDDGLVLERHGRDRRRQGEHDVEVGHGQQIGLPPLQPSPGGLPLALRAVPVAAGVVADRRVGAAVAARDMAAERRRAAGSDRRHDLELAEAQMPAMACREGVAMPVQDIRDLEKRPRHAGRGTSRRRRGRQQRERARRPRGSSSAPRACRWRSCRASCARAGPG